MNRILLLIIFLLVLFLLSDPYLKKNIRTVIKNKKNNLDNSTYTPDELFASLKYISTFLTNIGIKHWLMYGTLLGAIRNNDIIPYDYDFDLGAYVSDVQKILDNYGKLKKGYQIVKSSRVYGYNFNNNNKKLVWRVSLKIIYNKKIMGDIYLYQPFNDGMMRRYNLNEDIYFWPTTTFPTWFVKDLDIVKVRNYVFPSPRHSQILLEHWYGKTWKIPIKAKAQGGKGDKNSDYYGGFNNIKLFNLIKYLNLKNINWKEKTNNNLPEYPRKIVYVAPYWGIKWIKENDYKF